MWTIKITIIKSGQAEHTLTFSHSPITIGGTPQNDVVLGDAHVSKSHAHVIVSQGNLVFCDHSTNGSFCKGERIGRHVLQKGDLINIPPFELRMELVGAEEAYRTLLPQNGVPSEATDAAINTPLDVSHDAADDTIQAELSPASGKKAVADIERAGLTDSPHKPEVLAFLVIEGPPPLVGNLFPFQETGNIVGRAEPADIILATPTVSRKHASIARSPKGAWILTDLESLNGTFMNGERITKLRLRPGDEIVFGREVGVRVIEPQPSSNTPAEPPQKLGSEEMPVPNLEMSMVDRTLKIRRRPSLIGKAVQIMEIDGRVDLYNYNELSDRIRQVLDAGEKFVVIDFTHVNYIDHTGLGVLVKAVADFKQRKGELLLIGVSQKNRDAFSLSRLDVILKGHMFPDEPTATECLRKHFARHKTDKKNSAPS